MAMMGLPASSQGERGEYAIKLICVFMDMTSVFVQTPDHVCVCVYVCECLLLCLIVGLSDVPSLIKRA